MPGDSRRFHPRSRTAALQQFGCIVAGLVGHHAVGRATGRWRQQPAIFRGTARRGPPSRRVPKAGLLLAAPAAAARPTWPVAVCQSLHRTASGPTFFIVAADLLDHLRATFSPDSPVTYDDLFEQVRNVPLLVLDDLGAQSASPWAQEKLFQVINHRYNNALPTVITVRGPVQRLDETLRTRFEGGNGFSKVLQLGHFNNRLDLSIGEVPAEMLARMTFENFDLRGGKGAGPKDRSTLDGAMRAAQSFGAAPEGWLLLTGPRGSRQDSLGGGRCRIKPTARAPSLLRLRPNSARPPAGHLQSRQSHRLRRTVRSTQHRSVAGAGRSGFGEQHSGGPRKNSTR